MQISRPLNPPDRMSGGRGKYLTKAKVGANPVGRSAVDRVGAGSAAAGVASVLEQPSLHTAQSTLTTRTPLDGCRPRRTGRSTLDLSVSSSRNFSHTFLREFGWPGLVQAAKPTSLSRLCADQVRLCSRFKLILTSNSDVHSGHRALSRSRKPFSAALA